MISFYQLLVLLLLLSTCLGEKLSTGENVRAIVSDMIKKNEVMVFAKSYCPYSVKTRELLESLEPTFGFKFHIIDIDLLPEDDGPVIQMELLQLTGQKTVPNIFIGQKHIGGNSDLQDLKLSGMLDKMLRKVIKERSFAHHKRRGPFDFNEDALSL